ncbi:MAG: glycine cleavage system protein GcvH [Desulfovibrionaceae bacterium]|nr:glycine cleavage system protein GcvH [Desulfovibrionaceae bacterium]
MSNPAELLYSKSHEWAKVEGDTAVVGITHFAQESLGDITYVELPQPGDSVAQGQEFGSVESVKAASDLISPVDGEVLEVNEALENAPETCNSAPYAGGWLIKVKLSAQPEGLMDAAAYEAFCATESH